MRHKNGKKNLIAFVIGVLIGIVVQVAPLSVEVRMMVARLPQVAAADRPLK